MSSNPPNTAATALPCTGPVKADDRSRERWQYAVQFFVDHHGQHLHSFTATDYDNAQAEVDRLARASAKDGIERRDFRILRREVGDWQEVTHE